MRFLDYFVRYQVFLSVFRWDFQLQSFTVLYWPGFSRKQNLKQVLNCWHFIWDMQTQGSQQEAGKEAGEDGELCEGLDYRAGPFVSSQERDLAAL